MPRPGWALADERAGSVMVQQTDVNMVAPGEMRRGSVAIPGLLCLGLAVLYYTLLITSNYGDLGTTTLPPAPGLFTPVVHGLTFNSMLLHLLHGAYDVDPQTIGNEGFVRGSLTYSYFGIFLALLRLPFLFMRDFAQTDFTRLSCLVAVSLMGAANLASVLTIWRAVGRPEQWPFLVVVVLALMFGGPQIEFLSAAIWQEACFWGAALACLFVYLVIRGIFSPRGFTAPLLAALAAVAGICLLTRVSTAVGLYAALGLLMLVLAWRRSRSDGLAGLVSLVPAAALLCFFIAIAGWINYQRWGNPLVFADVRLQLVSILEFPDRVKSAQQYGAFDLARLGYGLLYYFLPIWALPTAHSNLLWSTLPTIDSIELPPSSFFITDPLLLAMAAFGLSQLAGKRAALDRAIAVPVAAGLFIPVVLMLMFNSMTFRYRLEFYPFFDLCAFFGFAALASRQQRRSLLPWVIAAAVGIAASHILWVLYVLGRFGDAADRLGGRDVFAFYRSFFH